MNDGWNRLPDFARNARPDVSDQDEFAIRVLRVPIPLCSCCAPVESGRDPSDVEFLVKKGALARRLLEERFATEMRPYLLNEARGTLTLELWLEEFPGAEDC